MADVHRFRLGPLIRDRNDPAYVVERIEVELERGERHTKNVVLRTGGWLRVRDRDARVTPIHPTEDRFLLFGEADFRMLLAPGEYSVTVPGPEGTRVKGTATVRAGEVTDPNFD